MKVFTKICLIVAAIAGGVGILGVVIGLAMGADISDLNSMGIYISPHQQVAVSGVIREEKDENHHMDKDTDSKYHQSMVEHGSEHKYSAKEKNITGQANLPTGQNSNNNSFSGIKRLEVEVQNAQITVIAREDSNEITYNYNGNKNIAKVEGTTLKLEDRSYVNNKIELDIYVPVGALKEIDIEALNGTLNADRMVADNISIEIDNASVQIEELVVSNEAELKINAGQMVVGYYSGKGLETECAMGSIMVVCEGKTKDYNFELECGMGNIRVGEDSYSGIGNDFRIRNDSPQYIHAECGLGEIILEFPNNL